MKEFESTLNETIQLEEILNHAPIGIAKVSLDGVWISINTKLCQILGYSAEELHQLTFQEITHPNDLEPDLALVRQAIEGSIDSYRIEKRFIHKSGHLIWVNSIISLVKKTNNRPSYFVVVVEDISGRKTTQTELKIENNFINLAIHSSLAGIYVYNIHKGINDFISNGYTSITGYTLDDLNGFLSEEFALLFHDDDREAVFKHIGEVINAVDDSYFEIEYRFKNKAGDWIWCLSRDKVFSRDENNQPESFIGTFIDITRIKNLEAELKAQARIDYLTDLDNRLSLNEKFNQEFNRSKRYKRPLSLLMIDVDNFKDINDTYGHCIGDEILVLLATKMKKIARDSDTVARYGGDEFIVILPEITYDQALIFARRIRDEFAQSSCQLIQEKQKKIGLHPTISVGVSSLSLTEPSSVDTLMKSADDALYKAKEAGRNKVK